jgi:hypothetical protein
MLNRRLTLGLLSLFLGALTLGCSGCQQVGSSGGAPNKELQQLGNQYMEFFRARAKTPADEAELKEFIAANMTDVKREILGISDVNKLFTSTRDNKPFVVRYGITITETAPAPGSEPVVQGTVVAYEAAGSGGYRQVFTSLGELTELKFDDLVKVVPDAK